MHLQLSPFNTIPAIAFRNNSLNSVEVWVFENVTAMKAGREKLQSAKHIEILTETDAHVYFPCPIGS